jgi:hypothetical protein
MNPRVVGLLVVIAAFGWLSTMALLDVGYWGIIRPHFESWGAGQVFADLCIYAAWSVVWMRADARKHGLPWWPFLLVTLVAGSFGVLGSLLVREGRGGSQA